MFSGTGWNWCINFIECSWGDFFTGLFLEGKLIGGGKQRWCKLLYTAVFSWLCTLLPKTRNPDQKSLLKTTVTLTSFSSVFGIFRYRFPTLCAVGMTPQKTSFYRALTSAAGLQLLLLRKLEKHKSFSCLLKPSASISGREAVTAGPRQSCSGHLESILWRKTKPKE